MTGPTTANRPRGRAPAPLLGRVHPFDLLVLMVALASVLPLARLVETPSFVDRVTVVNPTPYDIGIEVTDADRDGWMAVGTARRNTTSTFGEIIDQGDVWTFRFSAQGQEGGEMRLARAQLERQAWRFGIAEAVGTSLVEKGAPPPP